jgi:hypothetical protein
MFAQEVESDAKEGMAYQVHVMSVAKPAIFSEASFSAKFAMMA